MEIYFLKEKGCVPFLSYVTNWSSDNVSVIDTAANTVTATIPVGSGPCGVAITSDGRYAYVTNMNSNKVPVNKAPVWVPVCASMGTHPILFPQIIWDVSPYWHPFLYFFKMRIANMDDIVFDKKSNL